MPYTLEGHLTQEPIIYDAGPGISICVTRSEVFAVQLAAHLVVVGRQPSRGAYIERHGRHEHWVRVGCGLPDLDDAVDWVRVHVTALAAADTLTYWRMVKEWSAWRCRRKLHYPGGTPWAAHRIASRELRDYRNRTFESGIL